ncbi:hypothetical protein ES703_58679 [subsurface metagenome]
MKKKIFSVFFALVLLASFSLVAAVPVAAQGETYAVDDDWQTGDTPEPEDIDEDNDFATIQAAIDAASPNDTIIVTEGTYREYLHITTDGLTVQGAGIDQSIIDLDGLIPYWHYPGGSFGSRAGVLITGYGSPDDIIEGVTFSGFTVKNAGLNPPITATGTHTGADDAATLTDSSASWETDELIGKWVHNVSDKHIKADISGNNPIRSYGLITANTATIVTATLLQGEENDWDIGDTYVITPYEEYIDIAEDLQDDVPGIAISNGKDVSILYCKVIKSGNVGITVGKARGVELWSEGVTIDECIVSGHPSRGISVGHYVGPITITNNDCSNNGSPHPTDPTREYMGTGISVNGKTDTLVVSGGVISGNKCHDNRYHGITLTGRVNGITVEDNIVTGSNFDEDGAGIFAEGGWGHPERCYNIIIRDNIVTGNIRGIIVYNAQNCTVGGDTIADGNTVTTDSGVFDSGQAAIKLDNVKNIVVKNNTINSPCDGVGIRVTSCLPITLSYGNTITSNTITGAKFAGVLISHGAHDNLFTNNTITGTTTLTRWAGKDYEETQGDGVFIWGYEFIRENVPYPSCTGNVFHQNDIYGNAGDGMENQTEVPVDAENNWWGDASGPDGEGPGTGNGVSANVNYNPWYNTSELTTKTYYVGSGEDYTTIQDGINNASKGDTIIVAAGTYEETVTIPAGKDKLTLLGEDRATTVIANGIKFELASDLTGLTISNFTVQGNAVPVGNGVTVGYTGTGYLRDVEFTNNLFDGQGTIGMCFYIGCVAGTFSLIDNEITGYTDWGTVYLGEVTHKAGSAGPSLSTVLFEGNYIHNNRGSSVVYGNTEDFTDQFIVRNNEFVNNGGHEWFWATIELNNVASLLVEDNLFEGSPVGMGEVHGAGLYLTNDKDGLFSGSVTGNQFVNNWQGIYVFSGDVSDLHVHFNNFVGNDTGIEIGPCPGAEATVIGTLDATNNWWGNASGPIHVGTNPLGTGDPVSGNVLFNPWLLKLGGETYDKTLALNIGWTLVSTDNWISAAKTVGLDVTLAYGYTPEDGWFQATLADLEPVDALYLKTEYGGALGIIYSGGVPVASSKDLEAGWNLISSATIDNARAILSPLRYVLIGGEQGIGLATLVSQGNFNQHTASLYLSTLTDADWTDLAGHDLNPFDGYWVYMNAGKDFGVVPD